MRKKTIVHITTVHDWRDPRIFEKQCAGAARAGHDVFLVACTEKQGMEKGVRIVGLRRPGSRLWTRPGRMFAAGYAAYRNAAAIFADIYHFHDPEFLPWALLLQKKTGARVIYDIHEDYVSSIHTKYYIPHFAKGGAARAAGWAEKRFADRFDTVIAESYYRGRFPEAVPVLNYPVLPEGWENIRAFDPESRHLLYTGNINESRGSLFHAGLVDRIPDVQVTMAGYCRTAEFEKIQASVKRMDRLHIIGVDEYVPYARIERICRRGGWLAGLALFPYSRHYAGKALTKFFEYMMWGLPVVCTDFPAWKRLVEDNGVGICVNPNGMDQVLCALEWLAAHPDKAQRMGERGKQLVAREFNWESQLKRLLEFYQKG